MENSAFLGEFLGTFVLMAIGECSVANVLLKNTKGNNSGLIVITIAWGLAVTFGVFVAQKFGSPDAHLNPALTLAAAFKSGVWDNVLTFILAQFLGAFLGAFVTLVFYYPHFKITEDKASIQAVFCTSPAISHKFFNFFSEFFGAFILYMGVKSINAEAGAPLLVGLLVLLIGNSFGGTTGYAINPARDLAPRLLHFLLPVPNKGKTDWNYAWIPILGPILGALVGTLLV